jgi:16S rRNA processing protein RimM
MILAVLDQKALLLPKASSLVLPTQDQPDNGTQILLGHIVGFKGLRGEIKVQLLSPPADAWLGRVKRLLLASSLPNTVPKLYTVASAKPAGNILLVCFKELLSRTAAEAVTGFGVLIQKTDIPANLPNEYNVEDLAGLTLIDYATGVSFGHVDSVLLSGSMVFLELVVTHPKPQTATVPFQNHFFPVVNLQSKTISVNGLDGFFTD